jgi:TetR/AcrR family transcriptional regulator
MPRPSRKQQILETLAQELQRQQGKKITTASLASAAGVSEAALYRHFASKAKMFEALIEFAEESIFSRINQILQENKQAAARCYYITWLLLGFTERNPGITRLLLGDALTGENERLHARVDQFFSRVESQFRQVLREAKSSRHRNPKSQHACLRTGSRAVCTTSVAADSGNHQWTDWKRAGNSLQQQSSEQISGTP